MKYKVGDRVKVKSEFDFYEEYRGKQFVIEECDSSDNTYLCHLTGAYRIWFSEEKIEPADIWCKKITCIIHTSTQEEANMLFKAIDSYDHNGTTWASWWNVYKKKTCYRTNLGEVVAYGCIDNYIEGGEEVIEFSDLVATGGVCTGFRGGKIPTPSKPVSIEEQLGLPKGVSIHDLDIASLYRPMNIEIQPLELVCNEEQAKNIAERLNKELAGRFNAFLNNGISAKMEVKIQ